MSVLPSDVCQLEIGGCYLYDSLSTLCDIKVFCFCGEYGGKVETLFLFQNRFSFDERLLKRTIMAIMSKSTYH